MTQVEKLLAMLMEMPRTFRFRDFTRIMEHLGYELDQKGSTSGSRVRFYRARDGRMLIMHAPHPSDRDVPRRGSGGSEISPRRG